MEPRCVIEAYCRVKFETFHQTIEDNFSRTAFDLVSEYDFSYIDNTTMAMVEKWKYLFCIKFEKEWPKKEVTLSKNPDQIVRHILGGTFFAKCIKLGCKSFTLIYKLICETFVFLFKNYWMN